MARTSTITALSATGEEIPAHRLMTLAAHEDKRCGTSTAAQRAMTEAFVMKRA
jgi:hypothetical protein